MSKDQALSNVETLDFNGVCHPEFLRQSQLRGSILLKASQVRGAIDTWIERYERKREDEYASAKGHFSRFCGTMDAYSNLLSFIPDDDKYLKPFCGALTIIVQVLPRHGLQRQCNEIH